MDKSKDHIRATLGARIQQRCTFTTVYFDPSPKGMDRREIFIFTPSFINQ